jgi:hypothetical protein
MLRDPNAQDPKRLAAPIGPTGAAQRSSAAYCKGSKLWLDAIGQ